MRLIVQPPAQFDLVEISAYIAADDPAAADRMIDTIDRTMRTTILDNPLIGRDRTPFLSGMRSFPVRPYLIFYVPHDDRIEVLRVLHGARDLPSVFA